MTRRNFLWSIFCVNSVLFYCCDGVGSSPMPNLQNNIAANKFQNALQQQSFYSILTSIEERLRNLDNIYSMQVSKTLEIKLDQYERKLENMDTKITRLEALATLSLNKISENIIPKTCKDDISSKTNMLRKIDTVYEGISHRLSYMDRKHDMNFEKIQVKVDSTLTRLEKMEESMASRDSDIEAELSDAIYAIDDLKTTYNDMEGKLMNITSSTFNITRDSYKLISDINTENKKALNKFHDNIIENLQYIDNKTSSHYKRTDENNVMLKAMKTELKDDFNDYANKVADMNSYIWKNSDSTEDDLKMIATVVNSTKVEVQNGVRSLMLQIGKLFNKENILPIGTNKFEDVNKKLTTNFEKILTNQDLFLESCHRLQMDESQIESEISVMLEKLIDMLEKKMASDMKDIKNLEKVVKGHDWKMNRNVYQVNSNVISLFEKSTTHHEALKNHIAKIAKDLDALFAFVQTTTSAEVSPSTLDLKVMMDKLDNMKCLVNNSKNESQSEQQNINTEDNYIDRISEQIESNSKILQTIESQITESLNKENIDKVLGTILLKYLNCDKHNGNNIHDTKKTSNEINTNDNARKVLEDILAANTNATKAESKTPEETSKKSKNPDETNIDDDTRKAIENIFGPNPGSSKVQPKSPEETSEKTICKNEYLIDIRHGTYDKCEENINNTRRGKKKKRKPLQIDVRGNFNLSEVAEHEDSEETTENTTELEMLTEESVIAEISTESTTTIKEDIESSLDEIKPNNKIDEIE